MGSVTKEATEENESSDEEADRVNTRLQVELKWRGIHKYLKAVQQVSDEDTDIEVMYERQEILMTEMEYVLEK